MCVEKKEKRKHSKSFLKKYIYIYFRYECLCVQGVTGKNCEVNINECDSNPCQAGTCVDRIGGYTCECDEGYEGDHCQHDIDECKRYSPCEHGVCTDGRADYTCTCEPEYGGKNCSVELIGCQGNACQNGGTCWPYLVDETIHKFNCTCPNGYHGEICDYVSFIFLISNFNFLFFSFFFF